MKQLLLFILSLISIFDCNAQKDYRLEAIQGQIIIFDFIFNDDWPVLLEAIVLDGDTIEITSSEFNGIVDNILEKAKYMADPDFAMNSVFNLMFKSDMNPNNTTYNHLSMDVDYLTTKYENKKIVPIEDGRLIMRFVDIQAIAMIAPKDDVGGVYLSCGIANNLIPHEVYIPIFIINAEKTDDLKVKFTISRK